MQSLWIPLPRMQWRPPRFIVGGRRILPGLIQPRETQTLHMPIFQWKMNHLNNCSHHTHCVSGPRQDGLLRCSNGIPVQDLNRHYFQISNTVAYRDLDNGSLAVCQWQVYMLHKHLWCKINVPFLFHCCRDNQFRSSHFDLQRLKLWIVSTGPTSMA